MGEFVTITATSRYIYVSRADGTLLGRNLTVEDAIESAVNAGPGAYDIVYPSRRVVVSKVYGTLPASPAPTVPTALTLEEVTAGYASLSWTDDGTGTGWILCQLTAVSIQSGIAGDEPQEYLRIEQDSHGMYSSKPATGASKSAPI